MNYWLLLATMLTHTDSCRFINSDKIPGADLSRALPEFSALPPNAVVGYAPQPGSRRVLQYPELRRIGAPYGITPAPDAHVCFEWRLRRISDDDVRSAIRETLKTPEARVEIIAMNPGLAPEGSLIYPLAGLPSAIAIDPAVPVTWRGYVLYGETRKFQVWARVKVSAAGTRVVATQLIAPAATIRKDQVKIENYDEFPLGNDIARSLDEVVGRMPRRAIRPGMPVFRGDLSQPFAVQRGESVAVTAIAGAAQLMLDATAEASGRTGDVIPFRNPRTGRTFRAKVDGKGKAIVLAAAAGSQAGPQ
jgi:flagellar basal body P-ring formation protein FlgA